MFSSVLSWLSGKKTYVVAIGVGVCAAVQFSGHSIPEWVWTILTACGLAAIRAGVEKAKASE